ncbi:MAG: ribosome silencing factor [Planctomycetota bacterium]
MAKSPVSLGEDNKERVQESVALASERTASTQEASSRQDAMEQQAATVGGGESASGAAVASPTSDSTRERSSVASLSRARAIAKLAIDSQATDVMILDLHKRTALFDFFVVATGKSGRQLRAIADEIDDLLQKQLGEKRLHIDGYQDSRWIVLDYGDLVIHLFDREMRDFYRIEDLWSDAPRIPLSEQGA